MMPLLRPARAGDVDAVAAVLITSRRAFLPYAPMTHPPEAVRQWVTHTLLPSGGVTVAELGGAVVAVLAVSQQGDIGWVDQLYVQPGHEGQRLGSLLLQHAHDTLPRPVRLYTFQANDAARRFYERHGYVAIAFTDGAGNDERCPDVLYELPAAPPAPAIPGFLVRPLTPDDAAAWARYACLPQVRAYTSSNAETVDDVRAVIERSTGGAPGAPQSWGLFQAVGGTPDGRLVATVGFHTISTLQRTAEITYDVDPAFWGRGLATLACRATTRWGFSAQQWHRIQATTLPGNQRSQRVLLRCGYVHEGVLRHFRRVRGVPSDYLLYSALPGDVGPAP